MFINLTINGSGYGSGFCAFHTSNGVGQYWGLAPYPEVGVDNGNCGSGQSNPADFWQGSTSHEVLEGASDPIVGTAWDSNPNGFELGDDCPWDFSHRNLMRMSFGYMQMIAGQNGCSVWDTQTHAQIASTSWGANRLDQFAVAPDFSLQHKDYNNAWEPPITAAWEGHGGSFLTTPTAVSWGTGRVDVFGVGLDGGIYHQLLENGAWLPSQTTWESVGGIAAGGTVAAVSWGSRELDIFVVGLDGAVWHRGCTGSTQTRSCYNGQDWGSWESLGAPPNGPAIGTPAAVAYAANRLDVVAWGAQGYYHKFYGALPCSRPPFCLLGWSQWEQFSLPSRNDFVTPPTLAAWGGSSPQIHVFGLGYDESHNVNNVWHCASGGSGCSAFENLGNPSSSSIAAPLAAVSWGPGRVDLFLTDTAGTPWWDGGPNWGGWAMFGGFLVGSSTAVSWGVSRVDLFGRGGDGAAYHKYWNGYGTSWGPSPAGWETLAGNVH
jgi:hypothetical protein